MCTEKEEINSKVTLEFINGEINAKDYSKSLLKENIAESSPVRSFTLDLASTALSGLIDKIRPTSNEEGESR